MEEQPPVPRGRWVAWGVPFALSLALSAFTVGSHPQWQDSAIYLTAVHELGVLYPPGFVPYLLLCKGWTLLLSPFCDFTLAVHLFSSLCAALAAAATADAAFRLTHRVAASAAAGALAACGYTWWFSGLYAKGYALYILAVALLLGQMLRKNPRAVAVLAGLAWAVHPSAALLGPVILLYAWSCRAEIGARRIALYGALAALCAFGPSLLLPVLSAREPAFALGHVRGLGDVPDYLLGRRFTGIPGVWGFAASRWEGIARFAWEEFLGVGLAALALGLWALRKDRGRLLALAAWVVPVVVVTALFKIEGQHDLWLLAAYVPLYAVVAAGLALWRFAPAAAVAGVLWAAIANAPDVNQRGYDLVERYARAYLDPLPPDAILLLNSDDAFGACSYMQKVRGVRRDVRLVFAGFLWSPEGKGWYVEGLVRAGLKPPDERPPDPALAGAFAKIPQPLVAQAAFANANEGPIFFESKPPAEAVRKDRDLAAAGVCWAMVPAKTPWREVRLPIEPEEVRGRFRRERGQWVRFTEGGVEVGPEAYERRFLKVLLLARLNEAERQARRGDAEGYRRGAELHESVLRLDDGRIVDGRSTFIYGLCLSAMNRNDRAGRAFREALEKGDLGPRATAGAWFQLGRISWVEGDRAGAQDAFRRVRAIPEAERAILAEIDRLLQ